MTTREMTENDAPPSYSLTEAGAWADGYNAAVAEIGAELAKLKDPAAVHLNMLRGEIAKPSWESIKHVYVAEAEAERTHVERLTAALKTAEVAIGDWLHTYADDFCDSARVDAARQRIAAQGTLAYIAKIQGEIAEALTSEKGT